MEYHESPAREVEMTGTAIAAMDAGVSAAKVRPELLRLLDVLPPVRQVEVLDFARFLYQQIAVVAPDRPPQITQIELRMAPAITLLELTGLVHLGGDAVADTEALYDGESNRY